MKSLNYSSINIRCWYGFITLIRTIHRKFNYYSPIYKDLYDSSLIKKKTIRNTFPLFSWKPFTKSLNYFHIQTIIWHFLSNVKKMKSYNKGVIKIRFVQQLSLEIDTFGYLCFFPPLFCFDVIRWNNVYHNRNKFLVIYSTSAPKIYKIFNPKSFKMNDRHMVAYTMYIYINDQRQRISSFNKCI